MNTLSHMPSAEEIALAKLSSQELAACLEINGEGQELTIHDRAGKERTVKVPASALNLLVEVLTQLGQGNIVKITPIHAELTTQQAADILNMSRPTMIKILDEGLLPFTRVGNRRKVPYAEVAKYREALYAQRLNSLAELSALDQELGMGY
ncbi:excisionase family DNA-binding protein [Aeromonas media]|uniref:excisionase family DNA-binding protein n=1 Tax=Aeromonas media TaxID=651 RepID=UPI003D08C6CF